MNAGKDFVAAIHAVYSTASLVVTVATVVMSKITFRLWKRTKLRKMARTLLFIQAVIGTLAHGATTKSMDMESLYARMVPGKTKKNNFALLVLGRSSFKQQSLIQKKRESPYSVGCHANMLLKLPLLQDLLCLY